MWQLRQYRTVFNDFYDQCDEGMQSAIDQRLEQLQKLGNQAREPISKKLEGTDKIFECRVRAGKQQTRLLYFFQPEKRIVFVVAVEKDQRKLDRGAIALAERRKSAVESGQELTHGTNYTH